MLEYCDAEAGHSIQIIFFKIAPKEIQHLSYNLIAIGLTGA